MKKKNLLKFKKKTFPKLDDRPFTSKELDELYGISYLPYDINDRREEVLRFIKDCEKILGPSKWW